MSKFIGGIIFIIVVIVVAGFIFTWFGFFPLAADGKPGAIETYYAGHVFDRTVDKNAPKIQSPVEPTEDNLTQGMIVYTMNCQMCHGSPKKAATLGLYPPAPQFMDDPPDMPVWQNYWIIKHGARYTGMPAWGKTLSDDQIWKVTMFLGSWRNLPASIKEKFGDTSKAGGEEGEHEHH